jgi:hypothetical protein
MNPPQQPQIYDPDANVNPAEIELGGNYNGDGAGLKLSKRIHNEYGAEFQNNPKDRAAGYAKCIKCCGKIP